MLASPGKGGGAEGERVKRGGRQGGAGVGRAATDLAGSPVPCCSCPRPPRGPAPGSPGSAGISGETEREAAPRLRRRASPERPLSPEACLSRTVSQGHVAPVTSIVSLLAQGSGSRCLWDLLSLKGEAAASVIWAGMFWRQAEAERRPRQTRFAGERPRGPTASRSLLSRPWDDRPEALGLGRHPLAQWVPPANTAPNTQLTAGPGPHTRWGHVAVST